MDLQQSHHQLVEHIRQSSHKRREAYQVVLRIRKLLPSLHRQLSQGYRSHHKASKSERLSYVDPEYFKLINEYLATYQQGLEAKVQSETSKMLLQARQSQQAFYRASLHKQAASKNAT